MHRISNGTQINAVPGIPAVVGLPGYYTAGVPGVQAATAIDATQLNAIQEELAHVVESAGVALDKANNNQLLAALQSMFAAEGGLAAEIAARVAGDAALNTAVGNEAQARSAEDGVLNAAIGAEAQARSAEDGVLNSAIGAETTARTNFMNAFGLATGAAGWFKAANGWILQWGVGQTSGNLQVVFPTTFPNACAVVLAGEGNAAGWLVNGTINPTIHAPTNVTASGCTLISAVVDAGGATGYAAGAALFYIAIGF